MEVKYQNGFGKNFSNIFADEKGVFQDRKLSYDDEVSVLEFVDFVTFLKPSKSVLGGTEIKFRHSSWDVFKGKTTDKNNTHVMYAYNKERDIAVSCLRALKKEDYIFNSPNFFTVDGIGVKTPFGLFVGNDHSVNILNRDEESEIDPMSVVKKVTQDSDFNSPKFRNANLFVHSYQSRIERNREKYAVDGGEGIGFMEAEMSL